ncbi:MAG: radical SAM protein [Desulfosporosinus sp.]|nr:radical SAM protein [Desulfosporosinus sp.]
MTNNGILADHSGVLSGPLQISLDITNRCMAKCLHCFNKSDDAGRADELSDIEVDYIISQICDIKPFGFCFCGGEPLLRLNSILKASVKLTSAGVQNISMVSNGFLFTREVALELKRCGVKMVQISLDGATRETHERLRCLPGIYDRALAAINYLEELDIMFSVAFSPTKFNIEEFPEVVHMLKNYRNIQSIRVQPLMPLGKGKETGWELFPTESQYRILVNFIQKFQRKCNEEKCSDLKLEWGDPVDHLFRMREQNISQVYSTHILSNGCLSVSPYLPLIVGNLRRHTLKTYWDLGLGKVWELPIAEELAGMILSIQDMADPHGDRRARFLDSNIFIDLIDDNVMSNPQHFTLNTLYDSN